jgi:CBS domain-containing protein
LPGAGKASSAPRAAGAARKDVPRCHLRDRRADVLRESRAAGWDVSVVVDEDDVVLGLVTDRADAADTAGSVEDTMHKAPATLRPHVTLEEAAKFLTDKRRDHVLITTAAGRLVGLLTAADAKRSTTR